MLSINLYSNSKKLPKSKNHPLRVIFFSYCLELWEMKKNKPGYIPLPKTAGRNSKAIFLFCFCTVVWCVTCGLFVKGIQQGSRVKYAMFQTSPVHCGTYPQSSYTSFGGVKWKFKSAGKIFSSPSILNGIIYVGSEDHYLYAVELSSGKLLWKFKTGGTVDTSPAVYENVVYFGSFDGYYYAANATSGKLIWKFRTGGERLVGFKGLWGMTPKNLYMEDQYDFYQSSPVLNLIDRDLTVYFGSSDGNLYALDAKTGEKKWAYKTNGIIRSSPALYKGNLYFGSWDSYFYAIDAGSGQLKWKFKTGDQPVYHQMEGIQASATCYDGAVSFGCRDAHFYSLDAETGKLLWKKEMGGSWVLTTAAAKDGILYISTSDSYLFIALDAKTGAEKYKFKANGFVYSSAAISGNMAYFRRFFGQIVCA